MKNLILSLAAALPFDYKWIIIGVLAIALVITASMLVLKSKKPAAPPPPPEKKFNKMMRHCPYCRQEVPLNDEFCQYCGKRIKAQ